MSRKHCPTPQCHHGVGIGPQTVLTHCEVYEELTAERDRLKAQNAALVAALERVERECAAFYEACDVEHRKHGFTGPKGHCPALVAENLQRIAEAHLLEAGGKLMGFDGRSIYGDNRKKFLDLLLGACLKTEDRKCA